MEKPWNPYAGTELSSEWYHKRKAPGGKVTHYIDPVCLAPICGAPLRKDWEWPDELKTIKLCSKCKGIELQLSIGSEIDNERLK